MGCGSSVEKRQLQDQLKASAAEVERLAQDKEHYLRKVKEDDARLQKSEVQAHREETAASLSQLRAELQERHTEYAMNLERERGRLERMYTQELRDAEDERDEELRQTLSSRLEAETRAHHSNVRLLQEGADSQLQEHRAEAEEAEHAAQALRDQLESLRREHGQASAELREERERARAEHEECRSSSGRASALERRLEDACDEHAREGQRYADLERHLQQQMQELRAELATRTRELQARDRALQDRDKELADVNNQLADLQSLFDDVNQQLQTECGRIEKLQDTVSLCAKQGKELEALQGMLEESHRVLAQMRDALEHERTERVKASQLLEHEQQRTQLLLDVLKHFKEKLQGLTPQMLLSRLGCADPKALLAGALASANSGTIPAGMAGALDFATAPGAANAGTAPTAIVDGTGVGARGEHAPQAYGLRSGNGVSPQRLPAKAPMNGGFAFGSPRCPGSDGAASTIAPDTSSFTTAWAVNGLGSMAAPSATSARTPSPVPSPGLVSPGFIAQQSPRQHLAPQPHTVDSQRGAGGSAISTEAARNAGLAPPQHCRLEAGSKASHQPHAWGGFGPSMGSFSGASAQAGGRLGGM